MRRVNEPAGGKRAASAAAAISVDTIGAKRAPENRFMVSGRETILVDSVNLAPEVDRVNTVTM